MSVTWAYVTHGLMLHLKLIIKNTILTVFQFQLLKEVYIMVSYNEKVMQHFMNPHNVGEIENADGVGQVGNPVCGDMMTFNIKVKDNIIDDVKFKTFGCGAAIAVSSMVSDIAKGKTLEEALKITNKDVANELGGLPKNKMHCSNLGADALHAAIKDYQKKNKK